MQYALVYQLSIANVFRVEHDRRLTRIAQGSFAHCEWFVMGLQECDKEVEVFHCDQAGDIKEAEWKEGAGEREAQLKRFHPEYGRRT